RLVLGCGPAPLVSAWRPRAPAHRAQRTNPRALLEAVGPPPAPERAARAWLQCRARYHEPRGRAPAEPTRRVPARDPGCASLAPGAPAATPAPRGHPRGEE